jgi:hypothetical protein
MLKTFKEHSMDLLFKPKEYQLEVENITLQNEDIVKMIELFVRDNLNQGGQEVFYSHIDELKETQPALAQDAILKDALYQAVLAQSSVNLLHCALKDIEENPEKWEKLAKENK